MLLFCGTMSQPKDNDIDDISSLRKEVISLREQQQKTNQLLLLFGKLLKKDGASNKVGPNITSSSTNQVETKNNYTSGVAKNDDDSVDEAELEMLAYKNKAVQSATHDLEAQKKRGRIEVSKRKCRCSRVGFIEYEGQSSPLGNVGLCCSDRQSAGLLALNCILTPFLLIIHSIRIYLIPCLTSCLFQCCCAIGSKLCGKCWRYTDNPVRPFNK